ncbi:MAG: hypothetical protein PHR44_04020 [Candidatus Omnitrophica bacterium]|nr:hypothetical protein [Candidatus Omnitrophota bacterium]
MKRYRRVNLSYTLRPRLGETLFALGTKLRNIIIIIFIAYILVIFIGAAIPFINRLLIDASFGKVTEEIQDIS